MAIKKPCPHPEDQKLIRVTKVAANCETTVTVCGRCGEILSNEKTDC